MAKPQGINAIDIGSSKITCLITVPSPDDTKINLVGAATVTSRGVRRGQIVNIEECVSSITDCVESAERMAGFGVDSAFVSISGENILSQNSQGLVAITETEGEIGSDDVFRVIEAAEPFPYPLLERLFMFFLVSLLLMVSMVSKIQPACPVFVWKLKLI